MSAGESTLGHNALVRGVATVIIACVPGFVALVGPAVFWDQGCIEREALTFIRQYNADRPWLDKVFDPHANDLGTYQARELSYLIDLVDAKTFSTLEAVFGLGFSIPFSALASSLLLVIVFLVGAKLTTEHVDRLTRPLLMLCVLSSFGFVSTMGIFYRSAKPVLAVVILAWLFHVRWVQRTRNKGSLAAGTGSIGRDASITFALAVMAGLLDRQGLFYVISACAILGVHYRWTGQLRDLLMANVAALAVLQVYNFALAPLAIHALNGYWPDFSYQAIPPREVLRLPQHVGRAIALLVHDTGVLLGGSWPVLLVAAASLGAALWRRAHWKITDRSAMLTYLRYDASGQLISYFLLAFASQVAMFALMIARHGYVYRWVDHRSWYYPMPYLAVAVFGVLVVLEAITPRLQRRFRLVPQMLLLAIILGNVMSLSSYRESMIAGPWFGPVYGQCEALKTSLRSGAADPRLDPGYREFFDYRHSARNTTIGSVSAARRAGP